jgi:hypothetical protein
MTKIRFKIFPLLPEEGIKGRRESSKIEINLDSHHPVTKVTPLLTSEEGNSNQFVISTKSSS